MQQAAQPVATTFFFYMLSGLAILSGVLVITRKNAVHSALALILTLLCVAGLYLMLYAPFVAGVQIILYVGGIMVLFLFVIMLVNLDERKKKNSSTSYGCPELLAALGLGALFVRHLYQGEKPIFRQLPARPSIAEGSNTQAVGQLLYSNYMFPSRSPPCCCW